jgi:hypothetical protein
VIPVTSSAIRFEIMPYSAVIRIGIMLNYAVLCLWGTAPWPSLDKSNLLQKSHKRKAAYFRRSLQ